MQQVSWISFKDLMCCGRMDGRTEGQRQNSSLWGGDIKWLLYIWRLERRHG